ncbi:helix-turn-helix domain-containing protein [Arsenicibacter rosenii]|uniref:HTH cro/C1-type domain-containing protein n=1 Tax=Arsenicibacter rosenii TaxID=1750698 RepID=A0A1S2VCN4_9BACT|nr:helix-turn-helix transcriptional regulator [Arsenicibacter rosenii]OIN56474.1 hypothetical protein BLX24_24455 [Arsenicibacter rosenii]
MTRAELLESKGYWIAKVQLDLYNELDAYMEANGLNRTQLAERLGVTKGYISQVLNGDFDHKISKLVDLALIMGKAPVITYPKLIDVIIADANEENEESILPFQYSVAGGVQVESLEIDYEHTSSNTLDPNYYFTYNEESR